MRLTVSTRTSEHSLRENELLNLIAARSREITRKFPAVEIGPGDDAAVIRVGGELLLLTVDQLVEGRHFRAGTPIDLVTRKAIARSVSDIAAMGGTPTFGLATGLLPQGFRDAGLLTERLHAWAESWGFPLVGGDIATHSPEAREPLVVLTTTVLGRPHAARGPVLRSGARPGDSVYVTGVLGGSYDQETGLGRHLTFEPRVREAVFLCDTLGDRLTAMMDISDGLGIDASRLARQSGCRIETDAALMPCAPGVDWRGAVSDGEDYELLFTATGDVPDSCRPSAVPITCVGRVVAGAGCVVRSAGRDFDAESLGWQH